MNAKQMKYEFDVGYDKITNFDAPGYEPKEVSTFLTKAQDDIVDNILESSANKEKNRKSISRIRQVIPLTSFTAGNYPNGYITTLKLSYQSSGVLSFGTTGTNSLISDSVNGFVSTGFRVGDVITVTGSTTNDGIYTVVQIGTGSLVLSTQTPLVTIPEVGLPGTTILVDPSLRIRNERANINLTSDNFYYDRIAGNILIDVEIDPVDDDFYHANKDNPYKKPTEKKIWRIDSSNQDSRLHEYITDGTYTLDTVFLHIDRVPRPIIVPETTSVVYTAADGDIDGVYFVDFDTGLDCELDESIHRDIVDKAVKLAYAALQDQTGFQISSVQEQQEQQ